MLIVIPRGEGEWGECHRKRTRILVVAFRGRKMFFFLPFRVFSPVGFTTEALAIPLWVLSRKNVLFQNWYLLRPGMWGRVLRSGMWRGGLTPGDVGGGEP